MQDVGTLLVQLGGWTWFILAVALLILESFIPGVHLMWFGIAAVVVGIFALLFADSFPWQWQLASFGVVSLATILFVRRYVKAYGSTSDVPNLNARGSQYIGQIVLVDVAISGGRGRVKVGDTVWSARGPDMSVGSRAKVTGVDGTVLVVEPA